jgi:two-component system, cell cycle sensor histidine kinase and response regulator CckA
MNGEHENGNVNGNEMRMVQALRASELSYRRLFEAAQDGILILDVDTGRINDVNPFLFKLLGFSHDEMVGKTVGELSPFKDIWSNKVMLERLQKDGYVRYHDLPLETRDGRKIAVEFVSNVYQAGDKKVIQCNIRDITAHKKVENAAIRLAAIIESSDDAIIGKELDGTIQNWNTGAEKLFGYSAGEMTGTSMIRLIPADRQDEENQILEKIRHGESVRNFETVWQARDGRWIDVSVTVSPIKDTTGKIVGASKVARDITERKRAEEALSWSETQLKAVLESTADGILAVDSKGKVIKANRRFAELWRIPQPLVDAGDDLALLDFAMQQVSDSVAFLKKVQSLYGSDAADMGTLDFKDGRVFERYSFPMLNNGVITGRVWSFRDITERKQAEERLKLFRLLIERSNDAIEVVDSATGYLLDANESGCRALGYTRDEMLSLTVFDLTPEVNRALFEATNAQIRKAGHATLETLRRRKDGTTYPVEVSLSCVTLDREYVVAIVRDTTERRKLEAQFIEAQKMEAVGQLAGGIAHDFNNILAVIMGYNNLIQSGLEPDGPLRKYAEEIQNSAVRATGLTRQLLIFSRKQKVQPVVLDLNDAVKDLDKMLRRLVDEQIEMAVVPGKQNGRIKADPGYIWQVLMNLVVNARDAMPNGGKLTIATQNVTLDGNYTSTHKGVFPGNHVMLSVSDTGTGMTDEVKTHIFEAFFTTKPVGKGTGLGLATCQTIVQQSSGHIAVDSEVGKGTTFKIYFPQVEAPLDTDTEFIKAGPLPRGTETLLLVEDEPILRHMAQRVLEAQGYTVLRAANGQDALHVAGEHKEALIRLVVTDVIMPLMGGKVMAEWLKATYPGLKILFTSGYTDEAMAQHGVFKAGVNFLAKPYTPTTLARKVREVLDQPDTPTANPAR